MLPFLRAFHLETELGKEGAAVGKRNTGFGVRVVKEKLQLFLLREKAIS